MICSRYIEPPAKCEGCEDLGEDGLCYRAYHFYVQKGKLVPEAKCPRENDQVKK